LIHALSSPSPRRTTVQKFCRPPFVYGWVRTSIRLELARGFEHLVDPALVRVGQLGLDLRVVRPADLVARPLVLHEVPVADDLGLLLVGQVVLDGHVRAGRDAYLARDRPRRLLSRLEVGRQDAVAPRGGGPLDRAGRGERDSAGGGVVRLLGAGGDAGEEVGAVEAVEPGLDTGVPLGPVERELAQPPVGRHQVFEGREVDEGGGQGGGGELGQVERAAVAGEGREHEPGDLGHPGRERGDGREQVAPVLADAGRVGQPLQVRAEAAELVRVLGGALAQHVGLAAHDVVDPVLLEGDERVLVLDVQQLVPLEVAVEEEDRGVQPLLADLEPEHADRLGVVLVPVHELEADEVVEEAGGLVLVVRVRQRRKGLFKSRLLVAADVGELRAGAAQGDGVGAELCDRGRARPEGPVDARVLRELRRRGGRGGLHSPSVE
jgi:hypothetical protein